MATPQIKYKVRSGTIDSGKKYEYKIVALLSLRCVLSPEDMWISSNADGVGAFDDIIFHQGENTFMMQLKHKEDGKPILEREFLGGKGDFSLGKYFLDIRQVQECIDSKLEKPEIINYLGTFSNIYFVLFTNRDIKDCVFLEQCSEAEMLPLLNTSNNGYKVKTVGSASNYSGIYLLTNQIHVKHMDKQIEDEIEKIAKYMKLEEVDIKQVAEKFSKYVTDWAEGALGGHYCLTKQDIVCKLTELFLYKYEAQLDQEKCDFDGCKRKHVWRNILRDKIITVVDWDENISKYLLKYVDSEVRRYCRWIDNAWTKSFSIEQQSSFYQGHDRLKAHMLKIVGNQGKITLVDVYKCLWMDNQVPLLLEVNKSQQYSDILNILKLSNYSYKIMVMNKTGQSITLVNHEEAIKPFYTLEDLDRENKSEILNQVVKVQGRSGAILEDLVDETMHQYIKSSDILNILLETFTIGEHFKLLPPYFINQSVTKIFVLTEVLEKIKSETFLIEGNVEEYLPVLAQYSGVCAFENLNFDKVIEYRIITSRTVSLRKIEQLKPIHKMLHHLIIRNSKHLEWRASFGSVKNIRRFQVKLVKIHESDVKNKFSTKTNVISAAPGMGKSVLIDYVASQAPIDKWVLRIDLNKHRDHYKACKVPTGDASKHLEYFKNQCNNPYTELANVVYKKLADTKDIIVLLDGFDEVSVSYKEEVTNIAKCLQQEGYSVWLTTRPHMNSHLEEELNTFSVTLKTFTDNDQKTFLTKYFRSHITDFNSNSEKLLNKFVETLISQAKKNLNDRDAEFTGIPLQNKLLADAFINDCIEFLSSNGTKVFNGIYDLLYLYEHFINNKGKIFRSKFGDGAEDMLFQYKKHQQLFALKILFPSHEGIFKEINVQLHEHYKNQPKQIQILQIDGVVTIDENFNVNYIHRTFSEYLAAQWLSENVNSSNKSEQEIAKILAKERFTAEYKFLFSIFDRILAKQIPLHLAVINQQVDEALAIINSNIDSITATDVCQRSVIHIIALYSDKFPLIRGYYKDDHNIMSFISSKRFATDGMIQVLQNIPRDKLMEIKVDLLGYTPFDYSLTNRSLTVAETLSAKLGTLAINANIPLIFRTDLKYCAILNYQSLFNNLSPYFISRELLLNNINKDKLVKHYHLFDNFKDTRRYGRLEKLKNYSEKISTFVSKLELASITALELLQSESGTEYSGWDGECYSNIKYALCFGSETNFNKVLSKNVEIINKQDADCNTLLHYAILHRKCEIINMLLSHGAELNKQNINKDTPLHLAIKNEVGIEVGVTLISDGADLNLQNTNGDTPLHLALTNKQMAWTKLLISSGSNINVENERDITPVHLIIKNDWNEILSEISSKPFDVDKQDNYGQTPLFYAVLNNNLNAVEMLISKDANVSMENGDGTTPLHIIAKRGYNNILDKLLSKGDKVDKRDNDDKTLLFYAVDNNNFHIVKELVSNGAHVNFENNSSQTPLHRAVERGYNDILNKLLLSKRVDIDKRDDKGNTALAVAIQSKNKDAVKLLVANNANISVKNEDNQAPFQLAECGCDGIFYELLLSKCFDTYSTTDTLLFYAVQHHNLNAVKLLMSKGANCNVGDKNNVTVLHLAVKHSYNYIVNELLSSENIDIDKRDGNGKTALFYAVSTNNMYAVKALISSSANVMLANLNSKTPLHLAAEFGYDDIVKALLLSEDVDINSRDDNDDTPLHYSVRSNNLQMVKLFISKGANVNSENKYKKTPFQLAAEYGCVNIFELLSKHVDVNKKDKYGETPLFYAVYTNHINAVKVLISKGANVWLENKYKKTFLHLAAARGCNDIVNELVSIMGVAINKPDNNGNTPLFYAVYHNNIETVKLLIAKNADSKLENNYGKTPFHLALESDYSILIELLSKDVDIDKRDSNGNTYLYYAVRNNNINALKLIISKGANVNLENNYKRAPLHLAAVHGYNAVVNEISEAKDVDINIKDNCGDTPLFHAIRNNQINMVKLLISKGANVNLENTFKKTPLHFAAECGYNDILIELFPKVLDINKRDNNGNTPLFNAVGNKQIDSVKLLISQDADVSLENKVGKTPFHIVAEYGVKDIVNDLLSKDADINKQDKNDNTPLFYTILNNNVDMAELLISKGAK